MSEINHFAAEVQRNIELAGKDRDFLGLSNIWIRQAIQYHYAHNFTWLGRPILQIPQDIYVIQEIVWNVTPDLIIETGIAHGGSLILSASLLALLDYCEAVGQGVALHPQESKRRVIGIDIEIRAHNRQAVECHPMAHLIEMIEGSSTDKDVIDYVKDVAKNYHRILVFLDSNHTHEHVLAELEAYAPLTSVGSYCVVWDTGLEDLPENFTTNRPWGKGNNPKTAVFEYLKKTDCFEIDKVIQNKLMITASPEGFLKRVK